MFKNPKILNIIRGGTGKSKKLKSQKNEHYDFKKWRARWKSHSFFILQEINLNYKVIIFKKIILDQDLLDGGRKHCEVTDEMLSLLDVLVDGPFKEEEKDITLAFRGSRNQRVIDMQKSLKEKEVILYLE